MVALCHQPRATSPQAFLPATLSLGAAAVLASGLKLVGTGESQLVERLGKYDRALEPGLHYTIPLIERTAFACTMREQVLDIPPQKAITRDNAPLTADAVVYWKIVDPYSARYAVQDLKEAIQNLVLTQLRSEIGKLTLDETFSARQQMNAVLLRDLDEATDVWGVKVTRVEVRDIVPSRDITQAMEMQMAAERKKRASVLESEGNRQSQVNDAQGAADAVVLEAQAEARRLQLVAEGDATSLKTLLEATNGDMDKAMQILLLARYWTTQASLAESPNTKVLFYPSKATVPLSVEGLREVIGNE